MVEDLRVSDLLLTRDHGPQRLCWIGRRAYDFGELHDPFKPISIRAGALPCGGPSADLALSPQHRVLLKGGAVYDFAEDGEVLVPAKALTGLPGIRWLNGTRRVEYYALMLANHAVICAEGADVESFYPGPVALQSLNEQARDGLFARFPDLASDPASYGPLSRTSLTFRKAKELVGKIKHFPVHPEACSGTGDMRLDRST